MQLLLQQGLPLLQQGVQQCRLLLLLLCRQRC
jgi:hypothetical protein